MKSTLLLAGIMLICLPFPGSAQEKMKETTHQGKMIMKAPPWAKHQHYDMKEDVYFPDFHTFYDPENGYTFYQNGQWMSSADAPEFIRHADLNHARMKPVNEDIKSDPQKAYIKYNKMYPARKVGADVPMPPAE